jgi:transketolase
MRDSFALALNEISRERDDLFLITADISPASALIDFVKKNPKRVIDVGVSEQVMTGLAAGLAMKGFRPFTYSIANFSVFRPFEQIRVDLSYQNLPVTVIGVGAGLSYSALGGTHHSLEDIAILSTLPNFQILTPSDPSEVIACVRASLEWEGPTYIRLGKSGEPDLSEKYRDNFKVGSIRRIESPNNFESKKAILTYGPITNWVLKKLELNKDILEVDVFTCSSITPFPKKDIEALLNKYDSLTIVEEHYEKNGLGSIIKSNISPENWHKKINVIGANFEWLHIYGSQEHLRNKVGITSSRLFQILNG